MIFSYSGYVSHMRTTIVLKDQTADRVKQLARNEDRKLSNMISVLLKEALDERDRAMKRSRHLGSVLRRLQALASTKEQQQAARRLRQDLDG